MRRLHEENLAAKTIAHRIDLDTQFDILAGAREVVRQSPLVRLRTPGGRLMAVGVSGAGLGWTSDAGGYRYTDKDPLGNPWPAIPALWLAIANRVGGQQDWDSAIVNFYPPDAKLGWHQDNSEADLTKPIVTISLGDDASWAVRPSQDELPHRCTLDSGAVTLLAGESRLWRHSIERIMATAPTFSPLRKPGRISITLRVAGQHA